MSNYPADGSGPAERLARARRALQQAEESAAHPGQPESARHDVPGPVHENAPESARSEVPESVRGDHDADPYDVARQIALRQLTMAPRSRKQLEDKLRQRGCEDDVARVVLDRLTEVGLIDDAAYARMLVRSGQEFKGLAPRALSQQLRRKGVDEDIIEQALAEVADPDQDSHRARELVDKRLRTMRGLDRQVQTRRLAGFLGRKGYDGALAFRVIREALDELPEHQRD